MVPTELFNTEIHVRDRTSVSSVIVTMPTRCMLIYSSILFSSFRRVDFRLHLDSLNFHSGDRMQLSFDFYLKSLNNRKTNL